MKLNEISKPEVIMMIGAPGSGKSTSIKKILLDNPNKHYQVLSTDDIISAFADENNLDYNQAFFKIPFKQVNATFINSIKSAVDQRHNIIIDQTNMSAKARAKKLRLFPSDYIKIAMVFQVDRSELDKRLKQRENENGKHIPLKIINNMLSNFNYPTKTEFDKIINI